MSYEVVALSASIAEEWDDLVRRSEEGWLYHLSAWQFMTCGVPEWSLTDRSFALRHEGRLVAVMPLQLDPHGWLFSTRMGEAGPALAQDLAAARRPSVVRDIFAHALEIAERTGAQGIRIGLMPLTRRNLGDRLGVNSLVEHGYQDVSSHAWVLDLRRTRNEVWRGLSRNAHRKIDHTRDGGYSVRPVQDRAEIDTYHEIHRETYARTGATPHPKGYFLGIYDSFVRRGLTDAWAVVDRHGNPVAFTNIATFEKTGLYWTACCRDADYESGVYYLLVWHAIEQLLARGFEWFEVSEAFPNALPGTKEYGLNDFKRKFGGELRRFYRGELILRTGSHASAAARHLQLLGAHLADYATERLGPRGGSLVRGTFRAGLDLARGARTVLRKSRSAVRHVRHPTIPFLVPFWGSEEQAIAASRHVPRGAPDAFAAALARTIGAPADAAIVPTGSGRAALELLLRVFARERPGRTKVIIPSYGCRGTFDPIERCGLVPVFADVGADLLTPDAELLGRFSEDVLAVLLVNLAGKVADWTAVTTSARSLGIFTIEDHCHSLRPGLMARGAPHSDAAIFSFGIGKNTMATGGGAAVALGLPGAARVESRRLATEDPESARTRFRQLWTRAFVPRALLRLTRRPLPPWPESHYGYKSMNALDAQLGLAQLEKLEAIVAKRREHARRFAELLSGDVAACAPGDADDHVFTKLCVRLRDPQRLSAFRAHMAAFGVELEDMYTPLHLRDFSSRYHDGRLETTESLWRLIVNVPVRPNLSRREADRVARALGAFGAAHGP